MAEVITAIVFVAEAAGWATGSAAIGEAVLAAEITGVAVAAAATIAAALKTPSPEGLHLTYRQAIPPRRRGIGTARLGGAFVA